MNSKFKLPCHTSFDQVLCLCQESSLCPAAVHPQFEVWVYIRLIPRLLYTWTTLTDSGPSHVVKPSQLPKHRPLLPHLLGHSWPSVLSVAHREELQHSDYPHPAALLAPCMRHNEGAGFVWHQTGLGCGTDVQEESHPAVCGKKNGSLQLRTSGTGLYNID